jgi:transcriptional regulator with XRE-family HTH domain
METRRADPIDQHVGRRVRMRRLMLGMTQEKLADGLNLTFQQVQKYEKGTNRISASRLQQTAHVLQVTVGFFFERAPGQKETGGTVDTYVSEFLATSDGLALANAYMALPSMKLRRSIVALVKEIANCQ